MVLLSPVYDLNHQLANKYLFFVNVSALYKDLKKKWTCNISPKVGLYSNWKWISIDWQTSADPCLLRSRYYASIQETKMNKAMVPALE